MLRRPIEPTADPVANFQVLELPSARRVVRPHHHRRARHRDVDDSDTRALEGSEVGVVPLAPDVTVAVVARVGIELGDEVDVLGPSRKRRRSQGHDGAEHEAAGEVLHRPIIPASP